MELVNFIDHALERTRKGLLAQGVSREAATTLLDQQRPRLEALAGAAFAGSSWGPTPRIVTLNMGLGRDSLAMLAVLVERGLVAEGRKLGVDDVDAVVFSDTGAEWAHTIALLHQVRVYCHKHGLVFLHLKKPSRAAWRSYLKALPAPGSEHRRAALDQRPWRAAAPDSIDERAESGWYHLRPPILEDYGSRNTIVTRSSKDCTHNHKVEPIRKLLGDLALARFGLDNTEWGAEVRAGRRAPHLTLLGIAADEPSRAVYAHPRLGGKGPWYETAAYPLLELGVTKADEQPILERHGFRLARKSGCYHCPFQPVSWYWALRETDPGAWAAVVQYEAQALEKNPRMFIVKGEDIASAVAAWRKKNPSATIDGVLSKDYARGCAVEEREAA